MGICGRTMERGMQGAAAMREIACVSCKGTKRKHVRGARLFIVCRCFIYLNGLNNFVVLHVTCNVYGFYLIITMEINKRKNTGVSIPTCGNLFLPVRLLVWADGRGTVMQADSAARAELQGAPKTKVTAPKKIYENTNGSNTGRCLFVV
jgi:hypothetical protein